MRELLRLFAIVVLAASGQASYAATNSFKLNTSINGSMPSGSSPWMSATFADGAAGHVTLTNLMGQGHFISELVFSSAIDPTTLTLNRLDPTPPTINSITGTLDQAQAGSSDLKAGLFNIFIDFAPPPGGLTNVFNSTNGGLLSPVIFDISGTGLTANSFLLPSVPGGPGNTVGGYFMAAKVQGIPGGGSLGGSIAAIPEPEIYAMLLAGLGLMGFIARRRRQAGAAA